MDNQNEINNSIQNASIQNAPMQGNPNNEYMNQQSIFVMNSIIDSLSGWMRFMGILTIISGSITCLGIITAAIGVPLILAGIALTKASSSLKSYKQYNNPYILTEIFTSMNKYFKIQGITSIVYISIFILYLAFLLFAIVMSINNAFYYY